MQPPEACCGPRLADSSTAVKHDKLLETFQREPVSIHLHELGRSGHHIVQYGTVEVLAERTGGLRPDRSMQ